MKKFFSSIFQQSKIPRNFLKNSLSLSCPLSWVLFFTPPLPPFHQEHSRLITHTLLQCPHPWTVCSVVPDTLSITMMAFISWILPFSQPPKLHPWGLEKALDNCTLIIFGNLYLTFRNIRAYKYNFLSYDLRWYFL